MVGSYPHIWLSWYVNSCSKAVLTEPEPYAMLNLLTRKTLTVSSTYFQGYFWTKFCCLIRICIIHLRFEASFCKLEKVSFHQKLESIQHNSALTLTGAIRGTSTEKIYNELGLETLEKRRWYRKLCCFYKVIYKASISYLYKASINTFLTLFQLPWVDITQEIPITFPNLK